MASREHYQELAGSLAKGDLTVSRSAVLQGAELKEFLDELPAKSSLLPIFDYWQRLAVTGSIPSRRDIDPTELIGSALPSIVLIDVEEPPQRRYRYRLVGTAVSGIFGADYTGRYLDEMGLGDVFDRVLAFYSLVCNDPQPALLRGSYETRSGLSFDVARLAMPLSQDGVQVDTLFCAVDKT